jgi:hypothetical protein
MAPTPNSQRLLAALRPAMVVLGGAAAIACVVVADVPRVPGWLDFGVLLCAIVSVVAGCDRLLNGSVAACRSEPRLREDRRVRSAREPVLRPSC